MSMMPKKNDGFPWTLLLLFSLLFFWSSPAFSEQITLDSDALFSYASDLMARGEYDRAVSEFERWIDFFPENPDIPRAQYLIGVCLFKNGKFESARKVLSKIIQSDPPHPFLHKALFLTGESYYQQGIDHEAAYYFEQALEKAPEPGLKNTLHYRLGWTAMKANRFQEASDRFKKVEEESPLYAHAQDLSIKSLRGENLPYKSPVKAGALAAAVPGLGHAYLSRHKDALVAFLLNGLFIWAAVEAFHEDLEVLGGMLTFLEIGWYSGNIYSAVNSAHKYNRKLQIDFKKGLDDRIDLSLFATREKQFGLSFTFRF